MKFLLISNTGQGLGLALRLKEEGNDVAAAIRDGKSRRSYNGLVRKVQRWDDFLDPSTVVVFDSHGAGRTADRLRGKGNPVFGSSDFGDRLTQDKELAREFLKEAGAKLPARPVEGWFDGKKFLRPFVHTLTRNHLMNDDLGPEVESAGALAWPAKEEEDVLSKMEPIFAHHGYVGPVSVDSKGFKAHLSYDSLPALLRLHGGEVGSLISNLAKSQTQGVLSLRDGYAGALRVSLPPPGRGKKLTGFTGEDRPSVYFYDVEFNGEGELRTTGDSLAALTGLGETPTAAFEKPYEIAKRIELPERMYRTDLGPIFTREVKGEN